MQHGRLQRKRTGLDPAKDRGAEGHIGASGLHLLGHAKDCAVGDLGCFDYNAFGLGEQQRAVRRLLCELSRCTVLRDLSSESVNFRYRVPWDQESCRRSGRGSCIIALPVESKKCSARTCTSRTMSNWGTTIILRHRRDCGVCCEIIASINA